MGDLKVIQWLFKMDIDVVLGCLWSDFGDSDCCKLCCGGGCLSNLLKCKYEDKFEGLEMWFKKLQGGFDKLCGDKFVGDKFNSCKVWGDKLCGDCLNGGKLWLGKLGGG